MPMAMPMPMRTQRRRRRTTETNEGETGRDDRGRHVVDARRRTRGRIASVEREGWAPACAVRALARGATVSDGWMDRVDVASGS